VRVRETVPDSIFDRADAIELIDLTPDDLIQRLKEGKVYVPKQAERALEHYAKRMADRVHAPWTAISIETRRSLQLTDEQRDRLADTLRLAESLGAEAITIPGVGRRIADDLIGFAQANNITQIIIGKSSRSRWFEIMQGSVVHDLVRRAGNISVNVIAG